MFWEFSGDKYSELLSTVYQELIEAPIECDLPGDVDGNDVVNILDVVILLEFISGSIDEMQQEECADSNSDGFIDVLDVTLTIENILY